MQCMFSISGSVLGNVTAKDDDGPKELFFSIPPQTLAADFINITNKRGTNAEGITVDLVLAKALDRDYSVSTHMRVWMAWSHVSAIKYFITIATDKRACQENIFLIKPLSIRSI